MEPARPYSPTALPSVTARILAFVAIVVGGLCGGLIGWAVTDLQCGSETRIAIGGEATTTTSIIEAVDDAEEDCSGWNAGGAIVGVLVGAGGTSVVAVLVLRAMAEWRKDLDVDEVPPDA